MKLHEALAALEPRRAKVMAQVYKALASWSVEDSERMPTATRIAAAGGTTANWMSDAFGRGVAARHPDINDPTMGPSDRAVAEAKQYSVEPYVRGWAIQCRRSQATPRQRVWSLVPVVASWAGTHPGLAQLDDRALPVDLENLVKRLCSARADQLVLREILHSTIERAVHDNLNPTQCLSTATQRLAVLDFTEGRELDRRSLELAAAVAEFRNEALKRDATDHPQLAFVLRKAAKFFNPEDQDK